MSNQASFVVALINKVSAPARAIAASLERIQKPLQKLQKSKAFEVINKAADKTLGWAKAAALGIGAAGVAVGAITTAMVVKMARFSESARLAFKYLYGGAGAGNVAFRTSVRLAGELGQDVEDVTGKFIKLRAAQFTLGQSEEVFKLAADLKALTGDAQAADRAVTAITQIKAKGRLQSEELVGQLAEAGVSTVLVYQALGKVLNKTNDQVRALITAGKVSADVGIAAIKEAVKHKIGETELGGFALQQSRATLGGAIDRLMAAPKLFFLRVADTAKPAMKKVKDAIESAISAIGQLDVTSFGDFVSKVVGLLPVAIDLARQFASGFGSAFSEVLAGMDGITSLAGDQRQLWYDFGRGVAKSFALVFELVKAIGQAVAFLQTPMGKWVLGLGAVVLFLPKILAIGSALWTVFGGIATVSGVIVGAIAAALPVIGTVLGAIGGVLLAIVTSPVTLALGIAAAVAGIVSAIVIWRNEIGEFFVWLGKATYKAGRDAVMGLINGMKSLVSALADGAMAMGTTMIDSLKSVLGIASPSKVMRGYGQNTVDGFMLGLQDRHGATAEAGGELGRSGASIVASPEAPAARIGGPSRVVQYNTFKISLTVGAGAKMREVRDAAMAGVRDALNQGGEHAGT
jgi:tape measure domain-containing protein